MRVQERSIKMYLLCILCPLRAQIVCFQTSGVLLTVHPTRICWHSPDRFQTPEDETGLYDWINFSDFFYLEWTPTQNHPVRKDNYLTLEDMKCMMHAEELALQTARSADPDAFPVDKASNWLEWHLNFCSVLKFHFQITDFFGPTVQVLVT